MKTLIVGVGSILRGDDGIGTRVIERLEKETLPGDVELRSGDISGLDLLKIFPGNDRIVIIDAADMQDEPGSIKVFDLEKIEKADFNDQFSTHGMALLETLTLARELDLDCPIKIIGIQPENTGYDLAISKTVSDKMPQLMDVVKGLINANSNWEEIK